MTISALDVIFLILVFFLSIRGAYRGFVSEIMSFAALGVGIGIAVILTSEVAAYLGQYLGDSLWNKVIAFLGLFVLGYLCVKILERLLITIIDHISLQRLDQALGFLLGIIEGLLVFAGVIILLYIQPFWDLTTFLSKSLTAGFVMNVLPLLPDLFDKGATSANV